MKKKNRMIKGLDADKFDLFKIVITKKHGQSRGKTSYIAAELNALIDLYLETGGTITNPKTLGTHNKQDILRQSINQRLENYDPDGGSQKDMKDELQMKLDTFGILDERSRNKYEKYMLRQAARIEQKYIDSFGTGGREFAWEPI